MAKKAKKQESTAPPMEGYTRLNNYGGTDLHQLEDVRRAVTHERAAEIADEMKALAVQIAEKAAKVSAAKSELTPLEARRKELVGALESGELRERRDVYKYLSTDGRTVRLVDPETSAILEEREPEYYEEQTELGDESDGE